MKKKFFQEYLFLRDRLQWHKTLRQLENATKN